MLQAMAILSRRAAMVIGGMSLLSCSAPSDAETSSSDAENGNEAGSGNAASTGDVHDGSGGGEAPDDGGSSGAETGDPLPTVDPVPSGGCGGPAMRPGVQLEQTLEFGEVDRTYDLFVPNGYDAQTPLPLVFNFHGWGSNPEQQMAFSQYNEIAAEYGFAVVYPAGLDNSWNAGACCGESMSAEVDDVGFVRALVEELDASMCIDRARVYATGMSNGGFLSHLLACEVSDIFAAVAPVAAVLGIEADACTPPRVVPVHHTHGTADQLVPYEGGGLVDSISVSESIEGWVARNGCEPEPAETFNDEPVRCQTWSGCGEYGEVVLCLGEEVSHCWPGNPECPFGMSTTVLHASEASAEFFLRHPMR